MGSITRKQITFDIDTNELKKYYPKKNWNYVYELIKIHFKENGFEWRQGSVYTSIEPMTTYEVMAIIGDFLKSNSYLYNSMRDIVVTEVGDMYSLNHLFRN